MVARFRGAADKMASVRAFVGREEALAELERGLSAASSGEGRLLVVAGEPGIGKSRIADELSRSATRSGCVVVWGRAWEADGTPAHWPWLEVLRALAASPATAEVVARARIDSAELDGWLAARSVPSDTGGDEHGRFRLFQAVSDVLRRASAVAPLLVVLDDLHVADTSSLELLAFVARGLRGARVFILGTTRDASFAPTTAVATLVAKARREGDCLRLGRLSREDVARWIDRVAPTLGARTEEVFATSEGNPLFVAELLAAWRGEPEGRPRPLAIQEAIRAHLALIGHATRRVIEVASVLGREAPIEVVRALAANVDADPLARVQEAVAAAILTEAGQAEVRFTHVLVRDEVYGGMRQAARAELHRAAARHFGHQPPLGALAAHHALLGADAAHADAAAAAVVEAMGDACGRFGFEHAAALGERALGALGAWLAPGSEATLLVAIGDAHIHAGAREAGRRACARAADRAEACGDGRLLARAALMFGVDQRLGRDRENVQLIRRALAMLEASEAALRAQLLVRLSVALIPAEPGDHEVPIELGREALTLARSLDDDETLLTVLASIMTVFPEKFELAERFALNVEAIALARRLGRLSRVVSIAAWQVACWLELGRLDAAVHELACAEEIFAVLPPHHGWRLPLLSALVAAIQGKTDEAWSVARAVFHRSIEEGSGEGAIHAGISLMSLPYMTGEAGAYGEVDAVVGRTLAAVPGGRIFACFGDATCGRVDRVREALSVARAMDLSAVPGAAALGWAVVRSELAEHAPFFYELAAARAEKSPITFGPGAGSTQGPMDLLAGRLAHLAGRRADAHRHLERALAFSERLGSPPFIARCRAALAALDHVPASTPAAVAAAPWPALTLERRGEMWAVGAGGREILLKDARGLGYLDALVRTPHQEIHVLELAGIDDAGDAGPMLDDRAKRAYRERVEAVREDLDEATRNGDLGRAARARAELDALATELTRAVGLRGADKRAASAAERARINVQRRLSDVLRRVTEQDARLGRHLELSVKTGVFCRYAPTWPPAER